MMASAGITALLKKMDYKDVVIAIDGSLFRYCNDLMLREAAKTKQAVPLRGDKGLSIKKKKLGGFFF